MLTYNQREFNIEGDVNLTLKISFKLQILNTLYVLVWLELTLFFLFHF